MVFPFLIIAAAHPTPILLLFLIALLYFRLRPKTPDIPGPKSYPFLGILPHAAENFAQWPERCVQYCKEFDYQTWGGGLPNLAAFGGAAYFLSDPKNVQHVLSVNFANYEKGKPFQYLYGDFLGNGIFAADGPVWKMHRRVISHMFSRNLLRSTGEVTLQKLRIMETIFRKRIRRSASSSATAAIVVDVQDLFFRMTFDTTSYVAFGRPTDSLRAEGGQHAHARAFDEMSLLIAERFVDPFYQVKRALQIGSRERRIAQLKSILRQESLRIIHERRENARDAGHELGPDLLSRFIDQNFDDDDELHFLILNIMIAGRDTTACSLAWAFYELTRHPEVTRKIIQEVEQVIGSPSNATTDQDYSYEKIGNLKYTHCVVMEVLRLHPSVPNDMKFCIKQDKLPDGTVVTAGSTVVWLPLAMGQSEKLWGQDAHKFIPERFLNIKEPSPFAYTAFNAGPRTCLGKPLAIQTMKMTLAYLIPRFRFVDCLGHSGKSQCFFVRAMKDGFKVNISERKIE